MSCFRSLISVAAAPVAMSILLSACGAALIVKDPAPGQTLSDGVYEGKYSSWPNKATVSVSIKDGRIADVKILSHWASWIGKKAEPVIPPRIIEKQSANVDAVTGATNSSRVIMNAVQDALEKSYRTTNNSLKEKE